MVILVLISLSNSVYLSDKLLFSINLPSPIGSLASIFRASGRLFWPVYYLLILAALTILIRHNSSKTAVLILALLFSIQVIDLFKYYSSIKFNVSNKHALMHPLKSSLWNRIMDRSNHIVIIPSEWDSNFGYNFAFLAANHRSTLNIAYLARLNRQPRTTIRDLYRELRQGAIREDTLYVLKHGSIRRLRRMKSRAGNEAGSHLWGELDGYFVIAPLIDLSQSELMEFKKSE